jgi:hypothetical protein
MNKHMILTIASRCPKHDDAPNSIQSGRNLLIPRATASSRPSLLDLVDMSESEKVLLTLTGNRQDRQNLAVISMLLVLL